MNDTHIHKSHRNLPHWTKSDAIYWVTFRLADSLPKSKMDQWRREREIWMHLHPKPWNAKILREYHIKFGERYENWLDAGYGSCSLARQDCRDIVKDCLYRFHQQRVNIHHAVIMPNHVHALLEPLGTNHLSKIMQGIKGASARECNKILGTRGNFWMVESYDHIVRSEKEYLYYLRYIDENPSKAGLKKGQYWLA